MFPKPELGRHPPPLGLFGNVSPLRATQRWREQPVQARWHLGEVPAPRGSQGDGPGGWWGRGRHGLWESINPERGRGSRGIKIARA